MSKLTEFKAWCNGKAYPIPDSMACNDNLKSISIACGGMILGRFRFKTEKEYKDAKKVFYLRNGKGVRVKP